MFVESMRIELEEFAISILTVNKCANYLVSVAICVLAKYWIDNESSISALNDETFFRFDGYR